MLNETQITAIIVVYIICGFVFLGYYIAYVGKEKIELENVPIYVIMWFFYAAMMAGHSLHRPVITKREPFESLEGKPGWLEPVPLTSKKTISEEDPLSTSAKDADIKGE